MNLDLTVPFVGKYGIKTKYKNHCVKIYYLGGMSNIINSDDAKLIMFAANNINFTYSQKWNFQNMSFVPYFSYNYTFCDFTGELNDKNQNYILFPYKNYKIKGDINAHYLQTGVKFDYKKLNYSINADFDSLFFINQVVSPPENGR